MSGIEYAKETTMFRWLQRLFSGPATAPVQPAAPAAPAQPAAAVPAAQAAAQPAHQPAPQRAPAAEPAPTTTALPVSFEQAERVNTTWNAWLFDHDDDAGLETSADENVVLEGLRAILSSQQSGAALVRRMPGLVPQLLQSLRSDSFSGAALSRTISSDPVLVAAVIRLANHTYAGTGTVVASVEHAVILLGQEGLRQLITSVAFRPIVDITSGFYTRRMAPLLWEHSERSGLAMHRLAAELDIVPFEAFLAGLLQNVGLIVTLRMMDGAAGGEPGLGSGVFLAQLARDARQLSATIAREWDFPETVVRALLEQGGMRRGVAISPLGRLLKLTGYLGQVRMLVEHERLDEADPSLFAALPAHATRSYAALTASRAAVDGT
jgi:hypothetical protein